VIADGTGFSYDELYPLVYHRGTSIREVRAHVRVVVLMGLLEDGRRVVLGATSGGAYASEVKLLLRMLDSLGEFCNGGYFVADRCYDSVEVMRRLCEMGIECAIRVKQSRHSKVRSELRLRSMKNAKRKEIYGRRYLVESLFGTMKQALSSHIRVRDAQIAMKFALVRVLLFNLHLFCRLSPRDAAPLFFVLAAVCWFCREIRPPGRRLACTPRLMN